MIQVTTLYPNQPGKRFDHDYYVNKHMALVHRLFDSRGLVRIEVVKGVAQTMADVPNYTDIEPQFQISEIVG